MRHFLLAAVMILSVADATNAQGITETVSWSGTVAGKSVQLINRWRTDPTDGAYVFEVAGTGGTTRIDLIDARGQIDRVHVWNNSKVVVLIGSVAEVVDVA